MTFESSGVYSRRDFLRALAVTGATGLTLLPSIGLAGNVLPVRGVSAAEPPPETSAVRLSAPGMDSDPETTALRLLQFASTCQVPLYIAEEFLHREGFTDVRYVPTEAGVLASNLARGEVDLGMNFAGPNIIRMEAGDPIVVLAGGHVGCFELFATKRIRAIRDLKGKKIVIATSRAFDQAARIRDVSYVFLSSILAYVGLDPERDVSWVVPDFEDQAERTDAAIRLLTEEKVDAYLAFPPGSLDLRAKRIGYVVLNSMMDRPWNQYFCCMIIAHRAFTRKYPVATKRALRAILMSADLVGREPARAAKLLAARFKERGILGRYDYALQLVREIPYAMWRDYDPEDTLRFYALRLREAGLIKSSPQKLIAQGTNWRFLKELAKEMGR